MCRENEGCRNKVEEINVKNARREKWNVKKIKGNETLKKIKGRKDDLKRK